MHPNSPTFQGAMIGRMIGRMVWQVARQPMGMCRMQGVVQSGFVWLTLCVGVAGAAQPNAPKAADPSSQGLALVIQSLADTDDSSVRRNLLRGMLDGLEGQRNVVAPALWETVRHQLFLDEDPVVGELAMELSHVFGDPEAASEALAVVTDGAVDPGRRRLALASLLTQRNPSVIERLEPLLDDPDLTIDAIRGYAVIESPTAPGILLQRYSGMNSEQQRAILETLAARKSYAERLLPAIASGQVLREDVPIHVARSLSDLLGDSFHTVFGEVRPVGADHQQQMQKYKEMLRPAALAGADAARGRLVFDKTCAACHRLFGEGGDVGPDLTGSNRANLDYLLLNSVDPDYDIPDAYRMVQIVTTDGRAINGVLAEEDAVRIVLKTAEQPRVVIPKEDVETRRLSPKSMMPEGQLDQLKKQQVLDLIRYLQSVEQVERSR